jgi:hypothetical protein
MRKLKITQLPKMVYGGRAFNQVAPNAIPNHMNEAPMKVGNTLSPVPRGMANLEAERGETAFIPNQDGLPAHYNIGGKRHSEGGTPLNLPEDSFIFSDTKSMTLRDKELLAQFGESKPKTYASIAKKYDINKYRKVLADPNSDHIQVATAEKMIENNNLMLGKLALAQESVKGFPQGIPFIAYPYMMKNNISPEDILPQVQEPAQEQMPAQEMPMAMYGGNMRKIKIKNTPSYKPGGTISSDGLRKYQGNIGGSGVLLPQYQNQLNDDAFNQLLAVYNEMEKKSGETKQKNQKAVKEAVKISAAKAKATGKKSTSGYNPDRSRQETYDYNQAFLDAYIAGAQQGNYKPELPFTYTEKGDAALRQRQAVQSQMSGKSNIYGDPEVLDLEDFRNRHAWYFKDKQSWDPSNAADVEDFQTKYNEKAKQYGLPVYFTEKGPQGTRLDKKFGEHTWSAPGFNTPEKPEVKQEVEKTTTQEPIEPIDFNPEEVYQPYGYYPQDIANLATALASQIPDVKTWYPNVPFRSADPIYLKEDYSPIMESANLATQGMTSYSGRPAATSGILATMGKAARAAADHNLQVANINAGIYNDAQRFNAQAGEANAKYNAVMAQQDFDARELYEADRIKARNKKRAEVTGMFNNMLTNAADTYNMNLMSPYFKVDPTTGGRATLYNTEALKPNKNAYTSDTIRMFKMLKDETGASDEAIFNYLARSKAQPPEQSDYYNPYDMAVGPYGL